MANYTGGLTEMQKNLKRYRFCKHNTGWYEAAFHARYVKIINPFSQIYLILERSVKQLFSPEEDKQALRQRKDHSFNYRKSERKLL